MSLITVGDLEAILLSTELSATSLNGNSVLIYKASFQPVGGSGFSFGIAQLDIGNIANNSIAQTAYTEILNDALSDGLIDQAAFTRLMTYNNHSRYDLDPILSTTYQADEGILASIFNQ